MANNNLVGFRHYETREDFEKDKEQGLISQGDISFIADDKVINTHSEDYGDSGGVSVTEDTFEVEEMRIKDIPVEDLTAPEGGEPGQVLTKTEDSSEWKDIPKELPEGGTDGQVLTKTATGNIWKDIPSYQYTLTKTAVENVLTGDITSHTHSQYLTSSSLSNYYTKNEVNNLIPYTGNFVTSSTVNSMISNAVSGSYLPISLSDTAVDENSRYYLPKRLTVGSSYSTTPLIYFRSNKVGDSSNNNWSDPNIQLDGPRLGIYDGKWFICCQRHPSYNDGVFFDVNWVAVGMQTPTPAGTLTVQGSIRHNMGGYWVAPDYNGIVFCDSGNSNKNWIARYSNNGTNGHAMYVDGDCYLQTSKSSQFMGPGNSMSNTIILGSSSVYWKNVYAAAHTTVSDERVKNFIEDMPLIPLDAMADAPCMTFTWKTGDKSKTYGTKAQYWQKVNEDLVEVGDNGIQTLQYGNLAFAMAKSLAGEVRTLKEENKLLKAELAEIKNMILNK